MADTDQQTISPLLEQNAGDVDETVSRGTNSGLRPETEEFLDHLSGIGMHAYVAMRDPDPPGYQDWRKANFAPDGSGNYVSRAGEAYNNDDLKQIHGVLSRQAGNPIISNLLIGPNFRAADYLVWRNQNYNNDHETGGAWEDDDGVLHSEEALQQEFAAKSAARPGATSGQAARPNPTAQSGGPGQPLTGSASIAQLPTQNTPGWSAAQNPSANASQPGDWFAQNAAAFKPEADFLNWRDQKFRRLDDGRWEGPDAYIYTDKDLRDIYAIDHKQWPKPVMQSAQSSGTTVSLSYSDGTIERRTGNHPQRDNNPGNMEAGPFANSQGAIGKDKGFAVFPSPEVGQAALDALLKRSDYQALTVDKAIATFAPHYGPDGRVLNDTPRYQRNVRAALGVKGDTPMSALTPQQFETLKQKIAEIEGFNEARPNRKVKDVIQPPNPPNVIPRN